MKKTTKKAMNLQQMARVQTLIYQLKAKEKGYWFSTDTGSRVFVKEGQSKGDAIKERFGEVTKDSTSKNEYDMKPIFYPPELDDLGGYPEYANAIDDIVPAGKNSRQDLDKAIDEFMANPDPQLKEMQEYADTLDRVGKRLHEKRIARVKKVIKIFPKIKAAADSYNKWMEQKVRNNEPVYRYMDEREYKKVKETGRFDDVGHHTNNHNKSFTFSDNFDNIIGRTEYRVEIPAQDLDFKILKVTPYDRMQSQKTLEHGQPIITASQQELRLDIRSKPKLPKSAKFSKKSGNEYTALGATNQRIKQLKAISHYTKKGKLYVKTFLIDDSRNNNGWRASWSSIKKNVKTFHGKPGIEYMACTEHGCDLDHTEGDSYKESLHVQEPHRVTTIVDTVLDESTHTAYAIHRVDSKKFAEKILDTTVKYLSPSIWPNSEKTTLSQVNDDEWYIDTTDWKGLHDAWVTRPAYNHKARVVGKCTGDDSCITELKDDKALAAAVTLAYAKALYAVEEDGTWITSNGTRVFIKKGQDKGQAIAEKFGEKAKAAQKKVDTEITDRVAKTIKQMGIEDKVVGVDWQGSYAKGTDLPSSGSDMDLFISFRTDVSDEEREELGVKIGMEALRDKEPYVQTGTSKYAEAFFEQDGQKMEVQIVPIRDMTLEQIKNKEIDGNPVDIGMSRTPHQTKYMKENLKGKEKEVKQLKKWMKDAGLYDSSVKSGGFSGYSAEVLVDKLGSFDATIDYLANLKKGSVIDKSGGRTNDSKGITSIIDPIDPNRDLAAAFKDSKIAQTVIAAKKYKKDGEIPKVQTKTAEAATISFKVDNPDPDNIIPKANRAVSKAIKELKQEGFDITSEEIKINDFSINASQTKITQEGDTVKISFGGQTKLDEKYKDRGVPLDIPKAVEAYRKSNEGSEFVEEDGKLKAIKTRKETSLAKALENIATSGSMAGIVKGDIKVETGDVEFDDFKRSLSGTLVARARIVLMYAKALLAASYTSYPHTFSPAMAESPPDDDGYYWITLKNKTRMKFLPGDRMKSRIDAYFDGLQNEAEKNKPAPKADPKPDPPKADPKPDPPKPDPAPPKKEESSDGVKYPAEVKEVKRYSNPFNVRKVGSNFGKLSAKNKKELVKSWTDLPYKYRQHVKHIVFTDKKVPRGAAGGGTGGAYYPGRDKIRMKVWNKNSIGTKSTLYHEVSHSLWDRERTKEQKKILIKKALEIKPATKYSERFYKKWERTGSDKDLEIYANEQHSEVFAYIHARADKVKKGKTFPKTKGINVTRMKKMVKVFEEMGI